MGKKSHHNNNPLQACLSPARKETTQQTMRQCGSLYAHVCVTFSRVY